MFPHGAMVDCSRHRFARGDVTIWAEASQFLLLQIVHVLVPWSHVTHTWSASWHLGPLRLNVLVGVCRITITKCNLFASVRILTKIRMFMDVVRPLTTLTCPEHRYKRLTMEHQDG